MNFGQAVRASRISRKLTQEDLGGLTGISRQAVVLLESNAGRLTTLMSVQPFAPIRLEGLPPGNTFGERLRSARGGRPISAVAAAAAVSPNTIRALEAGGGTLSSFTRVLSVVAPKASVGPILKRGRGFKTVGGRANPNRSVQDYYATPAPVVRMLLDHEKFEGSVLEPAVGEARVIERVLHECGYRDVTCFDLVGQGNERRDFFDIRDTFDAVVTNPPFAQHVQFIKHAKSVARLKIALLLPLNYLTGKQRHAEIWNDRSFPLARLLVLNRGVNFLADDPFATHIQASQLYIAWFIWERSHEGPPAMFWLDSHAHIERGSREEA